MDGEQTSPTTRDSPWSMTAAPRNVFIEERDKTPSSQSPRRTNYFSSTTSSPCSFISAISSIDRDDEDGWTGGARDVHELVIYRSFNRTIRSDVRLSSEQQQVQQFPSATGSESCSALGSGSDGRSGKQGGAASQCGEGNRTGGSGVLVGQGTSMIHSHMNSPPLHLGGHDQQFHADQKHQSQEQQHEGHEQVGQGQGSPPPLVQKGREMTRVPNNDHRLDHAHSCPLHDHPCLPKSDNSPLLSNHDNDDHPSAARQLPHLPLEHGHEGHRHESQQQQQHGAEEKQLQVTATKTPISPIPLLPVAALSPPIVTCPAPTSHDCDMDDKSDPLPALTSETAPSANVLAARDDSSDHSHPPLARRKYRTVSTTIASLDMTVPHSLSLLGLSSPSVMSSSSTLSSRCTCACTSPSPNPPDDCSPAIILSAAGTTTASATIAAADHTRIDNSNILPVVQESGPDFYPVSSHIADDIQNTEASSSLLPPPLASTPSSSPLSPPLLPLSTCSNLSSLISSLSSPPLSPSSLATATVAALVEPGLRLPPGFEAMQDHQFFHHLALQQHCTNTTATESSSSSSSIHSSFPTQLPRSASTEHLNEVSMMAPSAPSSSSTSSPSSSTYHSPSTSIAWASPQRQKSPLRLAAHQVTSSLSELNSLKKDKGIFRVHHHQRTSSITSRLLLKPKRTFDTLPREVRIHIFRYLSTFQLVRVSRVSSAQ